MSARTMHSRPLVSCGCRRLVFCSSIGAVDGYRDRGQTRIAWDAPVQPSSVYGASKCFGEALGSVYAITHGISVICVRLCSPRFSQQAAPAPDPRVPGGDLQQPHLPDKNDDDHDGWGQLRKQGTSGMTPRDCASLFAACVKVPSQQLARAQPSNPYGFAIVNGISGRSPLCPLTQYYILVFEIVCVEHAQPWLDPQAAKLALGWIPVDGTAFPRLHVSLSKRWQHSLLAVYSISYANEIKGSTLSSREQGAQVHSVTRARSHSGISRGTESHRPPRPRPISSSPPIARRRFPCRRDRLRPASHSPPPTPANEKPHDSCIARTGNDGQYQVISTRVEVLCDFPENRAARKELVEEAGARGLGTATPSHSPIGEKCRSPPIRNISFMLAFASVAVTSRCSTCVNQRTTIYNISRSIVVNVIILFLPSMLGDCITIVLARLSAQEPIDTSRIAIECAEWLWQSTRVNQYSVQPHDEVRRGRCKNWHSASADLYTVSRNRSLDMHRAQNNFFMACSTVEKGLHTAVSFPAISIRAATLSTRC
eukprot:47941_6